MARSRTSGKTLVAGAAAGILGVALLAGGGGTFAVWSDTATVTPGTITAGTLAVEIDGQGTWTGHDGPIADIAAYRIVPGDVLTYTLPVGVQIEGDNLKAKLGAQLGTGADAVTGFGAGGLGDLFEIGLAVTDPTGDPVALPQNVPSFPVQESGTYTVTATFAFPDGTAGQLGQGQAVDFGTFTMRLEQVL
jgi:alternate signal-mediated exported protein